VLLPENVATSSPVDHHRWGGASEEEIRKLIEKKTKKKCIEYPVTVIIYCQTDRSFKTYRKLNSCYALGQLLSVLTRAITDDNHNTSYIIPDDVLEDASTTRYQVNFIKKVVGV
jgi:hypothetical protein